MGRDTSISIVNREPYEELCRLEKEEVYTEEDYCMKGRTEDELGELAFSEGDLKYWGKNACELPVKFFRQFKEDDGDLIITKEIYEELKKVSFLEENILNTIKRVLKREDLLIIYSTG